MRKELLIIVGSSGSGKTSFAKHYAKKNKAVYLDFDLLFDYKIKSQEELIEKMDSLIRGRGENSFVIDGYILDKTCPTINYLQEELGTDIKLCLCFAAPHLIQQRQKSKARNPLFPPTDTFDTIKKITESLFVTMASFDGNTIFVDSTEKTPQIIDQKSFPQRWRELLFLSMLKNAPHDKYYQDIELPSGVCVKGYSKSIQTWERLETIIDFKNKDVLDMGCFHGFFCFKAEEMGAKKITGIDKSKEAIDIAREVAFLKKSKALFIIGDIQTFQAKCLYDIVLVLNMLHYVEDIDLTLENIFNSGQTIIFEIPVEQEKLISKYASKNNFQFEEKINSHREEREIIIFRKTGGAKIYKKNIPAKYKFSQNKYKRQRLIKIIKSMKLLYPLKYIIRAYRKYRGTR